ncbi:hypothetical protein Dtox_3720 [Desulfofarcimen acetoxidans DSM 771]|uniref:Uncharacterized protein n=2 Tax=Desulfofarcimen acetoxidans TaxID=58138 RepID=C8VWR4_DESAS|nr:hypothetical protein Dtox_3720 [Desulfofarcimen acetoxidans DSM 771]
MVCLNRDGVIGLLMKMDFSRIRDESKRQTIVDFQVWAIETLGRIMDSDIPQQEFPFVWNNHSGYQIR